MVKVNLLFEPSGSGESAGKNLIMIMNVVSLSISVIDAHNANNSDHIAILCSQLEDAVLSKDFNLQVDSEHCYIIGRALYYCINYNNRCNAIVNESEILKRMFLCLTRAMFTVGEHRTLAAKFLFISLYRNWGKFVHLWDDEEITSSSIQNEYILHCIEDLLRRGVITDLNWCHLEVNDENWYAKANDEYLYRKHGRNFTFNDLKTGEEYINTCYEVLFKSI